MEGFKRTNKKMEKPRAYTEEEVKQMFFDHVRSMVQYWNGQPNPTLSKLEGLAFSILVAIDGGSSLPSFILAPLPHEEDKAFNISEGENYFPENHRSTVDCDIAGTLHDEFFIKEITN